MLAKSAVTASDKGHPHGRPLLTTLIKDQFWSLKTSFLWKPYHACLFLSSTPQHRPSPSQDHFQIIFRVVIIMDSINPTVPGQKGGRVSVQDLGGNVELLLLCEVWCITLLMSKVSSCCRQSFQHHLPDMLLLLWCQRLWRISIWCCRVCSRWSGTWAISHCFVNRTCHGVATFSTMGRKHSHIKISRSFKSEQLQCKYSVLDCVLWTGFCDEEKNSQIKTYLVKSTNRLRTLFLLLINLNMNKITNDVQTMFLT